MGIHKIVLVINDVGKRRFHYLGIASVEGRKCYLYLSVVNSHAYLYCKQGKRLRYLGKVTDVLIVKYDIRGPALEKLKLYVKDLMINNEFEKDLNYLNEALEVVKSFLTSLAVKLPRPEFEKLVRTRFVGHIERLREYFNRPRREFLVPEDLVDDMLEVVRKWMDVPIMENNLVHRARV